MDQCIKDNTSSTERLLSPDDPPPFDLVRRHEPARCLLVADHAGNAIPAKLRKLGLPDKLLEDHIAVDIGTRALAALLATKLKAPLILANYSRLVVDLNRNLDDPTAFIKESDGNIIPGNLDIGEAEKLQRLNDIYRPYHSTIDQEINQIIDSGTIPAIISIHSFTPVFENHPRPWHIGILWDKDPRIASALLATLRQDPNLSVGDNEPYSGRHAADYTIDNHGEGNRIANISIEVRQDLIMDEAGVEHWGNILFNALSEVLTDESIYQYLDE